MNYLGIYFLIMLPALSSAFLNYDRGIIAGQKNNWTASAELLKKELIQNPESAQLLYDTGVSSYKNGDYDYALSYFLKASESPQASASLQEQALFNAGNTQVALKQLENALATFQKVLDKNPKNAKAAHNKEIVKKMLEEQKQQQQQDQNKDKNKNEKQDKDKKEQQQNDQKENNEQNKKEQNKDQQQENKDQNNDQKKNDAQEKDKKEQEQKSEQEKQSPQNKQNTDQQKKDEQQKTESQSSAQSSKEEQPNPEQQLTPSMARMLDEREKKDAQLNKQLMRVMAGAQNAGADHHEHYW